MTAATRVRRQLVKRLATFNKARSNDRQMGDSQPRTLVILSTPRSGTHLLAHELAATGQVGLAEEFFHDQLQPEFAERYGVAPTELPPYIQAWHSQTAASTGVAAVVVFPDHVNKLAAAGQLSNSGPDGFVELLDLLPDPTVVLLERQSLVDQSISFNRSTQSWTWTKVAGQEAPPHPDYDFESLSAHLLRLITIREWSLQAAHRAQDRLKLRVAYESLVGDPATVVRAVCGSMGLETADAPTADSDRPERAADQVSAERSRQLLGDIETLTSNLRWAPLAGSPPLVDANIVTIADRQLSAMSDAIEAQRASAFRRRPVADAPASAGSLVALSSSLADSRAGATKHLRVLTHGLDQWVLQDFYHLTGQADLSVSLTSQWSDLGTADIVHLNSMSLGWGHANFTTKSALVDRARAAVRSLKSAGVPIIWSLYEPVTPGTTHVKLESAVRAEIAAAAAVIHVPNASVLERARELFDVPEARVIVGDLGAPVVPPQAGQPWLSDHPGPFFSVVGALTSLSQLGELTALVPAILQRFGATTTVTIAGSAEGTGAVAHQLRQLKQAGAVVVEGPVDAPLAAALLHHSDVLLVPCDANACFVPLQNPAASAGTPLLMTSCPAVTTGIGVDWSDHSATIAALEAAIDHVVAPTPAQPSLTISTLLAAAT